MGNVAVCTAGTADIPVAEEAAQTAEFFGAYVERIYDVGVHRLIGCPLFCLNINAAESKLILFEGWDRVSLNSR